MKKCIVPVIAAVSLLLGACGASTAEVEASASAASATAEAEAEASASEAASDAAMVRQWASAIAGQKAEVVDAQASWMSASAPRWAWMTCSARPIS